MIKNQMMLEIEDNFSNGYFKLSGKRVKKAMVDDKKFLDYYILFTDNKDMIDTHVLFSQIYAKAGLKVPIYFPAKGKIDGGGQEDYTFLIRDTLDGVPDNKKECIDYLRFNKNAIRDIRKIDERSFNGDYILPSLYNKLYTVKFCDKIESLNESTIETLKMKLLSSAVKSATKKMNPGSMFDQIFAEDSVTELGRAYNINPVVSYFKKKALVDKIKMNILDVAFLNNYRSEQSYFYKVTKGEIEEVVPLCVENSPANLRLMAEERFDDVVNLYKNDFDYKRLPALEVLKRYKNNLYVNNNFETRERMKFGTQLRNIANSNVKDDIKREIGYEVNKKIYDVLMRHLDRTGEELESVY